VLLSNTPHYPTLHGGALPVDWFAGLLRGLVERGALQGARAVLCGYIGQPQTVRALAQWLWTMRTSHPKLRVCIDPVLGDLEHGLYVDAGLPAVYREKLLPLACGLTPNHFELETLVGAPLHGIDEVVDAARGLLELGPEWIAVTSAAPGTAPANRLQVVLVTRRDVHVLRHARLNVAVKGTGDLFSAELLAGLLAGRALQPAARQACAQVQRALRRTQAFGWEELALPADRSASDTDADAGHTPEAGQRVARRRTQSR
jgi:pyridoxine kinase